MKKQILITMTMSMGLGGVERSLLGLLSSIDYSQYDVDLMLYAHHGELFKYIDKRVKLLPQKRELSCQNESVLKKLFHGCFYAVFLRLWQGICKFDGIELDRRMMDFLYPDILKKEYDIALGFFFPFNFIRHKIHARVKVGWIHTDYTQAPANIKSLKKQYEGLDYIAAVSEKCKDSFTSIFPEYKNKTIVIENILSSDLSFSPDDKKNSLEDMPEDGAVKILSVGRFVPAKNFCNVPDICKKIIAHGLNIKWYLIGYGPEERKIRDEINRFKLQGRVVILGKKENPYVYMNRCDLYVQPSVFEGKAVTVCEAQALGKPVVITDYPTAASQVINGKNGIIVPLENNACAAAIAKLLKKQDILIALSDYCKAQKNTACSEVEKIYSLLSFS